MSLAAPKKISILIADDHILFREGAKAVLSGERDMEVVGEAGNGREAVRMALRLHPHVVLMDITMPELKGFEAARRIHKAASEVKILILTIHDNDDLVALCLQAGAAGYVLKDTPPEQLLYAIRTVHGGEQYISPKVLTGVVREYISRSARFQEGYELLSDREREILVLLAEGESLKRYRHTSQIERQNGRCS